MIPEKENEEPNLRSYEQEIKRFSWEKASKELDASSGQNGLNIAYEAVDRHAETSLASKTALKFVYADQPERDLTYLELKKQSARMANLLKELGVSKGDRIFSLLGREPELYVTALGTLKAQAVFCPLFSVFGPDPVFQRLKKGDAKIIVTNTSLYEKTLKQLEKELPWVEYILLTDSEKHLSKKVLSWPSLMKTSAAVFSIPFTDPETPALLHFTSGTTGMPKGALHVHAAVLTHYVTGKYVLDLHREDIFWCTADPGWVTGTSYGIIAPLVQGVTSVVDTDEFDAMRWYSILEKQKISVWYTAPTAIRRLMRMDIPVKEKFKLGRLRLILSVGEPLNASAVEWGEKTFGFPILDNWWQTETGGIMIANYPSMKVKPGSMGKPLPGVEAAIATLQDHQLNLVEIPNTQGQLVLKKGFPSLFREYLHDPERYEKCFIDQWYITGDLAKKDEDGYFWFVGRADDIIKTSGHMVGPFEVESTLLLHPDVAEVAVIGKPEAAIGEMVKAFVVLKEGVSADSEMKMELKAFARKKLGPAVAPKEIEFTASIPKTRSGKILRRLLKAREMGMPEGDTSTLEQN